MMDNVFRIVILISPVHDCRSPIIIGPGGMVASDSLRWILNPYDAVALEEGLRLRQIVPRCLVSVLSMAATPGDKIIRECLAAGADNAVRIWDDILEGVDPYTTASVLAAALRVEKFELVLGGSTRPDLRYGQVGPMVAELLGLPSITAARAVRHAADRDHVLVEKRVPGRLLSLSCALPALITFEKGPPLRYPTFPGRRRAQSASITVLDLDAVGLSRDAIASLAKTSVERFTPPKPTRRSARASDSGSMSLAARFQKITRGGGEDRKESKIWECTDKVSIVKLAEHLLAEKIVVF